METRAFTNQEIQTANLTFSLHICWRSKVNFLLINFFKMQDFFPLVFIKEYVSYFTEFLVNHIFHYQTTND